MVMSRDRASRFCRDAANPRLDMHVKVGEDGGKGSGRYNLLSTDYICSSRPFKFVICLLEVTPGVGAAGPVLLQRHVSISFQLRPRTFPRSRTLLTLLLYVFSTIRMG